MAAIFNKLSQTRLRAPQSQKASLDSVIHDLLTWLEPYIRFKLLYSNVPTITAMLWGWAGLPPATRHQALPPDLAVIMLDKACHPHPSGNPDKHKLRMIAPKHLALLAWSASRVIPASVAHSEPRVTAAAAAIAFHSARRMHQFSSQGLSLLAAGLVSLAPAEGKALLTKHLADDAARRIGALLERQLKAGELVRLLGACADAGLQHGPLFEKAVAAALPQVGLYG